MSAYFETASTDKPSRLQITPEQMLPETEILSYGSVGYTLHSRKFSSEGHAQQNFTDLQFAHMSYVPREKLYVSDQDSFRSTIVGFVPRLREYRKADPNLLTRCLISRFQEIFCDDNLQIISQSTDPSKTTLQFIHPAFGEQASRIEIIYQQDNVVSFQVSTNTIRNEESRLRAYYEAVSIWDIVCDFVENNVDYIQSNQASPAPIPSRFAQILAEQTALFARLESSRPTPMILQLDDSSYAKLDTQLENLSDKDATAIARRAIILATTRPEAQVTPLIMLIAVNQFKNLHTIK